MINHSEISEIATIWDVPEETIEKDYALGWLLWSLSQHPNFNRSLVFRGGTCIKKCYVDTHRFSEDLDFAVFKEFGLSPELFRSELLVSLELASAESGIDFNTRDPRVEMTSDRPAIRAKVYFRGPRRTPNPISLKVDVEFDESLIRPPVIKTIGHPYSDSLPKPDSVYCYSLEELFGEKLRALGERFRPRDLYDVIYLFRRSDVHAEAGLVAEVLAAKCESKGVSEPSLDHLSSDVCVHELQEHWPHMLGHQLGKLPAFEDYFDELERLFAWLHGLPLPVEELIPIDEDQAWSPPPIEWLPGERDRLEPVRFAAVNRLLVDLGYLGGHRLIEPYSLRRTRDGNILLYAIRSDTNALRSYRVDRIQSVTVTSINFKPSRLVEFAPTGRLSAPPTSRSLKLRRTRRRRSMVKPRVRSSGGVTYVIRCTLCGKTFRRKKYDLKLKPHKHPDSRIDCPGTIAMYVRTKLE